MTGDVSWKAPAPRTPADAGTGPWHSPRRHRRLPWPLVLLISAVFGAAFLTAVDEARALMCRVHEGQLAYCTAYPPNEETRQ